MEGKTIIKMVASGMTSAAFSALLALPDRAPAPGPDTNPEVNHRPAAAGAPAAPARHPRPSCYGGAEQARLDLEVADADYGVAYDSPALWVKRGSPCRDINVRNPRNAAGVAVGQGVCVPVKVVLNNGMSPVGWVDTCNGWQVLVRMVPEGMPFVLRSALRPVDVTVAS